jgi:KAP family P-loop domain/Protein of unknown function (DUF2934)
MSGTPPRPTSSSDPLISVRKRARALPDSSKAADNAKRIEDYAKQVGLPDKGIADLVAASSDLHKSIILADVPSLQDQFGFMPAVRTLKEIVVGASTDLPLTIAIDGAWGSGKTSLLRMVENEARGLGYSCLWLNAWALERSEHLVAQVARAIHEEVRRKAPGRRAISVANAITRVMDFVAPGSTRIVNVSQREGEVREQIQEVVTLASTRGAFEDLISTLLDEGKDPAGRNADNRLVVLIDDVDRALPDQIMEVLRNLKLILESDRCIFLLGMDMRVVAQAIENFYRIRSSYPSASSRAVTQSKPTLDRQQEQAIREAAYYIWEREGRPAGRAHSHWASAAEEHSEPAAGQDLHKPSNVVTEFGYNFLEKLVQVRIPVPKLTRQAAIAYMKRSSFEDQIIEITGWASESDITNPRRLKRYINWLSVALQLLMATELPKGLTNASALRMLALRRDYPDVWQAILEEREPHWPEFPLEEERNGFRKYVREGFEDHASLKAFANFLSKSSLFQPSDLS